MNNILPAEIKNFIENIQKNLVEKFQDDMRGLILYGSWAKGIAKEDSDIDLLVIFDKLERETGKFLDELERNVAIERSITILPSSLEDFKKERLPLYTAIKREGKMIYGDVDLAINPEEPEIKYAEFFKRSREFESQKVKIAEELLEKDLTSGIAELCFVASKHAIQAALAMKGEGYSSKIATLLPLAEKYFGKEIAEVFRRLFDLYIKSEYRIEFLTDEESKLALEFAKEIFKVYLSHL